jgi:protein-disulfide isomerase
MYLSILSLDFEVSDRQNKAHMARPAKQVKILKATDSPRVINNLPRVQNVTSKLMVLALIIMAFIIGMLYQKVQNLQGGTAAANTTATNTATTPQQPAAGTKVTLDQIKGLWSKDIIKIGDVNAKALFVEVGDPSCPFCHAAGGLDSAVNTQVGLPLVANGGTYVAPVAEMRKLVDSGKASFAYVYYPGHGNGEDGMKALYCANEKGKFWQVHDLLMNNDGYNLMNNVVKNDKTQYQAVANFLKPAIDPVFMKSCLDSGKYDARLTADMAISSSLGVNGTPGFFINDTAFAGAYSWNDMKSVADAALK